MNDDPTAANVLFTTAQGDVAKEFKSFVNMTVTKLHRIGLLDTEELMQVIVRIVLPSKHIYRTQSRSLRPDGTVDVKLHVTMLNTKHGSLGQVNYKVRLFHGITDEVEGVCERDGGSCKFRVL